MKHLPTVAATSIVSLITGYFIGQYVTRKVKKNFNNEFFLIEIKKETMTHEVNERKEEEKMLEVEEEEEEEELDPLPETIIDAKKYDNFKLVDNTFKK